MTKDKIIQTESITQELEQITVSCDKEKILGILSALQMAKRVEKPLCTLISSLASMIPFCTSIMIINKNELFHFAKNDEKSTVLGQDDVIAQRTKCRMQYEFPGPV